MKTSLFLGTALTALLVTGAASAEKKTFTATLSGDNEIPGVETDGSGTAIFTVDTVAKTICGTVTYENLSGAPTAMHIHEGDDEVASGTVVQAVAAGASPVKVNLSNVSADTIAKITTTDTYFNVHTPDNGDGEIRGQLVEEGEEQECDAIPDGGSNNDGGSNGGGSGSDGGTSNSSGGNGASTTRPDSGTSEEAAPADDGGCSTTGSAPGSGLAVALGIGLAFAGLSRNRRKR